MSIVALVIAIVALVFSFSLFALLLVSRMADAPAADEDGERDALTILRRVQALVIADDAKAVRSPPDPPRPEPPSFER